MNQQQFQQFIEMGAIDNVVIFESADGLEVWAYGKSLPMAMSNRIQKTRRPGPRLWATWDSCISWIRACGWSGPFTVDTATPGVRS